MTFVTHPEQIRRILKGVGWPITIPEFDLPSSAPDGFVEPEVQIHHILCHRVINASGALGGFSRGLERKKWLLNQESDF